MPTDGSFSDVMSRLRERNDEAARAVFQRFSTRLIALARLRLSERLRKKVDPEDVMQSVYKSFFARAAEGRFDVQSWDGLWSLLTVFVIRKCCRYAERYGSAGRDVRRESAGDEYAAEALSRDPRPDEAAALADLVEGLMLSFDSVDREVVSLALQGYSVAEVVEKTGRAQRSVYRVLERVREQLCE